MARLFRLFAVVSVVGCGVESAEGPADHRAVAPAAPAAGTGVQFRQPDVVIPAGEERMICWAANWVPEQDVMTSGMVTYQGHGGHHLTGLRSIIPRTAGSTFDCTSIESMTTIKPMVTPTAAFVGDEELSGQRLMPEGYAVRIPAGSIVIFQSHYVNATRGDIVVSDVTNLYFQDESVPYVEANYHALSYDEIDLAPGESTISTSCAFPERRQFLSMLPHMHEFGRAIKVEREHAGNLELIVKVDRWSPELRDRPIITLYEPENPLVFEAGDRIRVTCTYNNTKTTPVQFPSEMCVAFGAYFPAVPPDGFEICDDVPERD